MIALCIALWLLSGFLAAWIDHKYVYHGNLDTHLGLTLLIAIGGLASLVIAIAGSHQIKLSINPVIFKAKENK